MVDEAALLAAERGSVVAPAGCGKTELIARAVRSMDGGRALVLTHTHAGVKALRDRLHRLGAARERVHVETIAGWALRYSTAYPVRAVLPTPEPAASGEWDAIHRGAAKLLDVEAIRRVVRASYSRVFVDEYQDCTRVQHGLIRALAEVTRCAVLGDPLQGIFGFAGASLSWRDDIEATFPALGELEVPWRWHGKNEALGQWLRELREKLTAGAEIDLSTGPLKWGPSAADNQRAVAFGLMNATGQVVAIRRWPNGAHDFARSLGGAYPSMEEIECNALLAFTSKLDQLAGTGRAGCIIDFAAECMTEVGSALRRIRATLAEEEIPDPKRLKTNASVADALAAVVASDHPRAIRTAMQRIEGIPGVQLFRRELWREASRTLREFEQGNFPTIRQAAWSVRNRLRASGRSLDQRLVSRTLLIKGLEFDHALVLDADEFEHPRRAGDGAKNFYVAATRGCRSLTILSGQPTVRFSAPIL